MRPCTSSAAALRPDIHETDEGFDRKRSGPFSCLLRGLELKSGSEPITDLPDTRFIVGATFRTDHVGLAAVTINTAPGDSSASISSPRIVVDAQGFIDLANNAVPITFLPLSEHS